MLSRKMKRRSSKARSGHSWILPDFILSIPVNYDVLFGAESLSP